MLTIANLQYGPARGVIRGAHSAAADSEAPTLNGPIKIDSAHIVMGLIRAAPRCGPDRLAPGEITREIKKP